MLFIVFLFCFSIVSINTLERCPGASEDSQEDFPWKFNSSSIVAYGTVTEVNGNVVTFKANCALSGALTDSTIQFTQASEVANTSECHYLAATKNYIVFIEPMKTEATKDRILYRLADMEEIEITSNTLTKFMDDECNDEDDYGIPMTIFYADSNNKCGRFTAPCNENTKTSILNLNYSPLSKTSTFLGGSKNVLAIPTMNDTDSEIIASKSNGGISDEKFRNTATVSTIFMPTVFFITILAMLFNN